MIFRKLVLRYFFLSAGVVLSISTFAQKVPKQFSKKDVEKMITEAKAKMGQSKMSNDEFIHHLAQQKPVSTSDPKAGTIIPMRNTSALASMPNSALNPAELKAFVKVIRDKTLAKLNMEESASLLMIRNALNEDAQSMGLMGLFTFYKGGAREGIVLTADANLLNIANSNNLANLAAMMSVTNKNEYAIPILKTLLQKDPLNTILLNNIGQAFIGLGEVDSATKFLRRCLRQDPKFAKANLTAAVIAKTAGNITEASRLVQEALKIEISETSEALADQLGIKNKYAFYAKDGEAPDYFNAFKFRLPLAQTNVLQYETAKIERAGFISELNRIKDELSDKMEIESDLGRKQQISESKFLKSMSAKVQKGMKAMQAEGTDIQEQLNQNKYLQIYLQEIQRLKDNYQAQLAPVTAMYNKQKQDILKKVGEGSSTSMEAIKNLDSAYCFQHDKIANAFLSAQADKTNEYRKLALNFANAKFAFQSKYYYMAGFNDHLANAGYYQAAILYINRLLVLANDNLLSSICKKNEATPASFNFQNPFNVTCPISLTYDIKFVKIKLDCKELSISGGEGIKFEFKNNYIKSETTMAVGLGADLMGNEVQVGGTKAKIGSKIGSLFYLTLNKSGEVSDVGLKNFFSAGASISSGQIILGSDSSVAATYSIINGFSVTSGGSAPIF